MRVSLTLLLFVAFCVSTTLLGVALGDTSCGATCATQITAVTDTTNNGRCMCQDYNYVTKYRGCIQRACSQDNLHMVVRADGAACNALGVRMPQPGPELTPQPPLLPPAPTTDLPPAPATNPSGGNSGSGATDGSGSLGNTSAASSIHVVNDFSLMASLGAVVLVFAVGSI